MVADLSHVSAALLSRFRAQPPGRFNPTALEAVSGFWTDRAEPRQPLSYDPGLAIMLSGKKIGYLDGQRFEYGAGSYLAIGLPVVFECETFATPDAPLFGLFLRFDPVELRTLREVLKQDVEPRLPARPSLGVEPLWLEPEMADAVSRLIRQLLEPYKAAALGGGTLREIFFHALQDAHGRVLLSLTQMTRPEARIASLLRGLEGREEQRISVDALAREAGMSPATLHRHFKCVTGYAPRQYLKRQRLMKARGLLLHEQSNVAQAAHAVGYSSAAQFSRDFRAFFGHPPSETAIR